MSYSLWKSLLEHDVEGFRLHLAQATQGAALSKAQGGPPGSHSLPIASPGSLGTSPKASFKSRKNAGHTQPSTATSRSRAGYLTRADINSKDSSGRTLLHHAVSYQAYESYEFVKTLLEVPYVDLYIQDAESGWTPLHRALYFGNISSAQALMQRDLRDATDYTTQASHAHAGGLVKIKDNEGNSPFEVFGLTIAPRDIQSESTAIDAGREEIESTDSVDLNDQAPSDQKHRQLVQPFLNLHGDEVFAFGSNKNLTLGTGDEDDRQFPERLQFVRPEHVLQQLHEDHIRERLKKTSCTESTTDLVAPTAPEMLPTLIRNKRITIQDVHMSKLHTAILTDDPVSNLHVCGFGPGGRLGTGDENTVFSFKCITGGGLARKCVSALALGQDHTIAICSQGEVFTWGSNKWGQLGYALPDTSSQEIPVQVLPRQLYGLVKRETIIGAAASSIHSAIFTGHSLYTFGKNDGQLGFMDADARSLDMQILPRRVAPSVLQSPIRAVSAIDRATIVLLDNRDVIVFTHYGWTKVVFDLHGPANQFLSQTLAARYGITGNHIDKVTSGGNTICALSSFGEVFTIEVPKVPETVSSNASTTNPSKARNALPSPTKIWSLRKDHMAALDAAVSGQDGSVILCTTSGSVWRKEKRANLKSTRDKKTSYSKDYKSVRVPHLNRAVAVRSNAYGAYTAIRRDCAVLREQIGVEMPSLWTKMFGLLVFQHYGQLGNDSMREFLEPRFWRPANRQPSPALVKQAVITSETAEDDFQKFSASLVSSEHSGFDAWVTSNLVDVKLPVHAFILKGRSKILRAALAHFQESYYFNIPDIVSIEYDQEGINIRFHGADFLTLVNLVLYLYTDEVVDVWHFTSRALQSAARYRTVRNELMKIANRLELRQLERAVRLMVDPEKSLSHDFEAAFLDPDFFSDADVIVELADGAQQPAHSVLLAARCPFFEGLFNGRAGGIWTSSRRGLAEDQAEAMKVDLKHVDDKVFSLVLRHIYADTGPELFDEIVTDDFEEFMGLLLEVMSIANELMIDRLVQICQALLGKHVNMRNVCGLVNAVAECSVTEFKKAALEYICLNLEGMMEQRLLEELDSELLEELDEVVKQNQIAFMPFARSGKMEAEILERHPLLPSLIESGRQRRIDSMRLRSHLAEDEQRSMKNQTVRIGSFDHQRSPHLKVAATHAESPSPGPSPDISAKEGGEELPFEMEEELVIEEPNMKSRLSPALAPEGAEDRSSVTRSSSRPPASSNHLSRGGEPGLSSPILPISASSNMQSCESQRMEKKVWHTSSDVGQKLGLKDIMDQASAARVSNLSESLGKLGVDSLKPNAKISQKQKRRQHQQEKKIQIVESGESPAVVTPTGPSQSSSPWQTVQRRQELSSSTSITSGHTPPTNLSPCPPRSTMTLRQTVAGNRSVESVPHDKCDSTQSTPGASSLGKSPPPMIQSIRHLPPPARIQSGIDSRTPLAEILSQQQREKLLVKEAAVKRSLEEIQQEQEFQEWWDKESARVQKEVEPSSAPGTRSRAGNGRGRGRARSHGGSQGQGQGHDSDHRQSEADRGAMRGGVARNLKTVNSRRIAVATTCSSSAEQEQEQEQDTATGFARRRGDHKRRGGRGRARSP